MTVRRQNPPQQNDNNEEGARVEVGQPLTDEQLREAMGSFGDTPEEGGAGQTPAPAPAVSLEKTRTWG